MIKNIKTLIVIVSTLFIVGCGGTTSTKASIDKESLNIQVEKTNIKKDNKLDIDFLVKNGYGKGIKVNLSDFNLNTDGCTIKSIKFTPDTISLDSKINRKILKAEVAFETTCIPKSYSIDAKTILTLDGQSNEISFTSPKSDLNLTNVSGVNDTNSSSSDTNNTILPKYTFFNIPKYINIDKADKEYNFKIQLVDLDKKIVSGQNVYISIYDTTFGELKSYSSTTDSNGFAHFSFTSPKSIKSLIGKSLKLTLNNETGFEKIDTDIELNFNQSSNRVHSGYSLANETNLIVEYPKKDYSITVDLLDANGIGIVDKIIKITTPDNRFGFIENSTAKTNGAGRARFKFTSSNNIEDINGKTTLVTLEFLEDGVSISKQITITINKKSKNEDKNPPIVVIPNDLKEITITNNSQKIDIPIRVFKNKKPYSKGFINIQLPKKVLDGVDVGSFNTFEVPIEETGIATLHYTAPSNIKALDNIENIFQIYHSENITDNSRESIIMKYKISNENNYISINYNIDILTDNNFSMGIPDIEKKFTIILKDTKGNIINNINITSIKVTTLNSEIASLLDTNSNSLVYELSLENRNNVPFILKSKSLSGLVPIKVIINFKDINGDEKEISKIVNVRVMSGPASAISISYLSSEQDKSRAKYIDKFVVSVTDEYGNRVNTQPNISLGAVVGYAVDGRELDGNETANTKRLFYGKSDIDGDLANGRIDDLGDNDVSTTNFEDIRQSNVFKYVNAEGKNTDKLIVFGEGKNYNAMGKWDFNKYSDSILNLEDNYLGEIKDGLYYAVGHNYYQDQCLEDGREWLGSTDSETYQLDDEGSVIISYKYDYHLMGKDAMIWVNLNGYQPDIEKNVRIGEAIKHTLRGQGLRVIPEAGYSLDKNETKPVIFEIWHAGAKNVPYRNAHFGARELSSNDCTVLRVESSNQVDARSCGGVREGRSYITYMLQATEEKGCTFGLGDILVADEF